MTESDAAYFYDTYALIEIIKANPAYRKYVDEGIALNKFVLTELTFSIMRDYSVDYARKCLDAYWPFIVEVSKDVMIKAMSMRIKERKRNLSMTDCVSYVMAKILGIKFLTGDEQFRNMENVEFVK